MSTCLVIANYPERDPWRIAVCEAITAVCGKYYDQVLPPSENCKNYLEWNGHVKQADLVVGEVSEYSMENTWFGLRCAYDLGKPLILLREDRVRCLVDNGIPPVMPVEYQRTGGRGDDSQVIDLSKLIERLEMEKR